ncbi:mitogen-activated protein kinase kinase kinase 5-like isoform X7 [Pomacea canaliculata]|uniref:mitogen-activated protein kinase kinase kinase 5-like isoform X7 n=1 Tax=Pomacea canaliculata TaxID=400727 RepID=UPI000D73AEEB|nr:mitogen-activated protein kinase kinase kinase 5-like isoform X7 [Pomacea canaliculata]
MKVVCVIGVNGDSKGLDASGDSKGFVNAELLAARQKALSEIENACKGAQATLEVIQFQKLDFGETSVLDVFYNADVAIVDMSISMQQAPLFYHIGIRQSMGMGHNVVIHFDQDPETTLSLRLSCSTGVTFLPYQIDSCGLCYVVDTMAPRMSVIGEFCVHPEGPSLSRRLRAVLSDVDKENIAHSKERFLNDLRKVRDTYKGEELKQALKGMRRRLDDPELLSLDAVFNMLISFRDIQDYQSMVKLVDDLEKVPNVSIGNALGIQYLYAFALNRNGARDKALTVILKAVHETETPVPDMICLCGRIYKDKFVDSDYTSQEDLENAINWYRKGFEVQPNEYAGINLATLLVISGKDFSTCSELQRIGITLNNLIGKKGSLSSLTDYWDVATFFEISVLAEDYAKASQAADCMYKLEPPDWYLKSTIGNITLIDRFRKKKNTGSSKDHQTFAFWMEFFSEAASPADHLSGSQFPVLILEPRHVFVPSYIQVNMHADVQDRSVRLWHVYQDPNDYIPSDWTFPADTIKRVSLYKRDSRAIFLYIQDIADDDFHIFFSCESQAQRFYSSMSELCTSPDCIVDEDSIEDVVEYVYDEDDKGNRILLGRGTYGTVYAARDKKTQVKIAIKEVPEKFQQEVQPLHEEIKLHSRLSHKNIVRYLGSVSEDGFFKIFMEQVPGGSLSQLLRSKWGPLKENEVTIAFYTKQILEGLKYLHDNKIVHRDIKGDNVLVNTYSGVLKISDFGTSKRLSGINPCADTFAGTIQYMAPEVIDRGSRGYGPPADIWSLGCTVIEMATGKPPFIELGSPEAAMFKVGFYKMHPQIPESMSSRAQEFLLRCFEPDPLNRASASELLEHPFIRETLGHKKKRRKVKDDHDFLRSASEPCDKNVEQLKLKIPQITRLKTEASCSLENISSDELETIDEGGFLNMPQLILTPAASSCDLTSLDDISRSFWSYHACCSSFRRRSHSDSLAQGSRSFSDGELDRHEESKTKRVKTRNRLRIVESILSAESSPVATSLLSPDVDGHESHLSKESGFYLLRKDSERRSTLVHILGQDMEKICQVWLELLHRDATISHPKLTTEHLKYLLSGIKGYILNTCQDSLREALGQLREDLQFDASALMEIMLALYHAQEAVSFILKTHNIKPHWMFALDNLVRGAVQMAITILSPDLGANLAGNQNAEDEVVTSGVSSANSAGKPLVYKKMALQELYKDYDRLHEESLRMMQELIDVQKAHQQLLSLVLQEKKISLSQLQVIRAQGVGAIQEERKVTEPETVVSHSQPALVAWMREHSFDQEAINKVCDEEYTLQDLLELVTWDDLRGMNLRGGVRCRLWRAILEHRTRKREEG